MGGISIIQKEKVGGMEGEGPSTRNGKPHNSPSTPGTMSADTRSTKSNAINGCISRYAMCTCCVRAACMCCMRHVHVLCCVHTPCACAMCTSHRGETLRLKSCRRTVGTRARWHLVRTAWVAPPARGRAPWTAARLSSAHQA